MPRVSRREFLKFIVSGGVAVATGVIGIGGLSPIRGTPASAATGGTWSAGPTTNRHPVHVALLYTGKVLCVAGSGYHQASANGPFKAVIWDPKTGAQTEKTMTEDLFCCGHALLPDGNVLLAGGTLKYQFQSPNSRWWGLNAAYEFDVTTESFLELPRMAQGRWYPTLVELPDGKVQVVEGYDEYGYHNLLNEIYDPEEKTWTLSFDPNTSSTYCVGCDSSGCANLQGAGDQCYGGTNSGVAPALGLYPRMHLLPSGLVAVVGQKGARRIWNPATLRWHAAGTGTQRSYGTSVLLPLQNSADEQGRILVAGGSPKTSFPAVAANTAEILEPSGFSLNSRTVAHMSYPRRYCNPVILPTGKVIIFGGTRENNDSSLAVYSPEMFDPQTETWSILPAHAVPRLYHSGALLLRDGRVWTMGTSYSSTSFETRTEIFSPDYIGQPRPSIPQSLPEAHYGELITINTEDAPSIAKVSLVKVSSTTHHYNTDQRLVWLQIQSSTSSRVTVSSPLNAKIAPPGYYMLHVINDAEVPSEGAMIRVSQSTLEPVFYNVPSSGDAYAVLRSGGDTRAGEEAQTGSALIGRSIKRWTVYLRKRLGPTGQVSAVIRRKSDDAVVARFSETIDAAGLPTSFSAIDFTLSSPYVIRANDRILVEYSGPERVDVEASSSDRFDGSLTRRVKYGTGGYSGSFQNTKDTLGIMSSE